ncbi:MAG: arsenate reductase (glutaredoxin) [Immundisolibacterales bacterium]|nr:arsenate reductase (glutaredoxin) [Immundisolibacterales bacterium]
MPDSIVIYHNPRCSKSRAALALIHDRGVEPEVVEYLETPLDAEALRELLATLGMSARDLVRSGEAPYRELGLAAPDTSEDDLVAAIAANPILMQRPVVRRGDRAVVGRPPERIAELLDP